MPQRIKKGTLNLQDASWCIKIALYMFIAFYISACGSGKSNDSKKDISVNETFTVSGEITAQRNSDIDLDLNSPQPLNNAIEDPQLIANPSTLGGYLSGYSGHYSHGEPFNIDTIDAYRVSLVENQKIELSIFSADTLPDLVDITLKLIDSNNHPQLIEEINEFKSLSISVPSDDMYTLVLEANTTSAPLLYTLTLSQTILKPSAFSFDTEQLKQQFVPGEVLIRYKNHDAVDRPNAPVSRSSSHTILIENFQLEMIDSLPSISTRYRFNQRAMRTAFQFTQRSQQVALQQLEQKAQTLELIHTLQQRDDIEFAEPNYLYHTSSTPNDPRLPEQWNLSMLSSESVWEAATGQDTIVAVLDTGIDENHEEWGSKVLDDSYDFVSDKKSAGDGNGFDINPHDEGRSFHGSHVAGIIAATANNGKGIAGLAFDADIMALRVLGVQDVGESSDIAQAILYAAGLSNTSMLVPAQRADIINMSFGSKSLSKTIKRALDKASEQGVILIAAAGNSNTDKAFYPAAHENVIGVGAVSSDKTRSSFSNKGVNVQLLAPGGTGPGSAEFDGFQDAIISTVNANNYAEYQGTSMAAPHLSAVAALMRELRPDLTGSELQHAIEAGEITDTVESTRYDAEALFGAGILNAVKAVKWAANSDSIIPAGLTIYPSQFGFIGNNTKAELYLGNPGSGTVNILSIEEHESWLVVTPKATDLDTGLGEYLIEITPLSPLDQGEIIVSYQIDGGQTKYSTLTVFTSTSQQTNSNVGSLFISLFKESDILNDDHTPFMSIAGRLVDGVYQYCFNSVPVGNYLLSASTDNDKDKVAFDQGEAIGSYPLSSRPDFIEIKQKSLKGINFDIQYPDFSNSTYMSNSIQRTQRSTSYTLTNHPIHAVNEHACSN